MKWNRISAATWLVAMSISSKAVAGDTLRTSPGGSPVAVLTEESKWETLETMGAWTKIRIEGWIPAGFIKSNKSRSLIFSESRMEAGGSFFYKNVSYAKDAIGHRVIGEITNCSQNNYATSYFRINLYDHNGKLIETALVQIPNFMKGQTKSFDSLRYFEIPEPNIGTIKVQFDSAVE